MTLQYTLIRNEEGDSNITVFAPGRAPLVAHSSHPAFEEILGKVLADDESALDLFDVTGLVKGRFEPLSERLSVSWGCLYLDNEPLHNALADQIMRFVREGVEDWKPLVRFYENLLANPSDHSREQLYTWLEKRNFSITPDGMIVGYKGVSSISSYGEDGETEFFSTTRGYGIVNGEVFESDYLPNPLGAIVEMPRTMVVDNPNEACSVGLHIADFDFAKGFGSVVLEVHVNPRDVVSIPSDSNWSKMRACRYSVIGMVERSYEEVVVQEAAPKEEAKPKTTKVRKGDTFEDTDKRRPGRTFIVTKVEGDKAVGKSMPAGITRAIKTERLLSRKYKKVTA